MAPLDYDHSVFSENTRGEWVPSIPLPFFGYRKRCSCGAKFWTMSGYQGHYALEHILGFDSRESVGLSPKAAGHPQH